MGIGTLRRHHGAPAVETPKAVAPKKVAVKKVVEEAPKVEVVEEATATDSE